MNLNQDFSSEQPEPSSDIIMAMAMTELHDMLIEPMQGKLTQEQDSMLALIGLTFKIIAEKATALEAMQQDEVSAPKNDNFYRNLSLCRSNHLKGLRRV